MFFNIFYLAIIQVANYIFPLITLPYLARVLGVMQFGSLMLAQALIQYFITITEYGFNLSATKKISLAKDQYDIDRVYTNTLYARLILAVICFISAIIISQSIKMFENQVGIISILFLGVLGNCLFPLYLFQGLELMKNIAWISILSKILMTMLTFILVRDVTDINGAAFALTMPLFLPGVISIFYISYKNIATIIKFDFTSVKKELKDGSSLFISQVAISFYTTFNSIMLGYFYGPTMVGIFAAADKLRIAAQSCYIPIQQVVFPRINKETGSIKIKLLKYGALFLSISFIGSICVFIFGQQVAILYLGNDFIISAILFKWMSILLFIIGVAIVFGQWGLITIGKEKTLTKIYMIGAIIHIIYSVPLVIKFNVYGMLASVIATELVITMMMIAAFYFATSKKN